jgi:hypothetical protein
MSAIATAAGFAFSFGAQSYIKFPSWLGSWVVQFGATNVSSGTWIPFPFTFPNSTRSVFCVNGMNTTAANATTDATGYTTSGFNGNAFTANTGSAVTRTIGWIALGN